MRITLLPTTALLAAIVALGACSSAPAPAPAPPPAAAPAPAPAADVPPPPPAEPEIQLDAYSSAQAGDWHVAYRNWQPTTVFEFNGHYYPHTVNGARPVQVYSYKGSYFTPPRDKGWTDKRFDAKTRPTDADYGRARPRP